MPFEWPFTYLFFGVAESTHQDVAAIKNLDNGFIGAQRQNNAIPLKKCWLEPERYL